MIFSKLLCKLGHDFLFCSSNSLLKCFSVLFRFCLQDVTAAEGMELFSKEAVEAVESLSKELQTVRTQISQVGVEWLYLS